MTVIEFIVGVALILILALAMIIGLWVIVKYVRYWFKRKGQTDFTEDMKDTFR